MHKLLRYAAGTIAFTGASLLPAGALFAQTDDPDDADAGARRIGPAPEAKDEGEPRRRVRDRDDKDEGEGDDGKHRRDGDDRDDGMRRRDRDDRDRDDDDDRRDDGPLDAKVPGWAHGKGYRLRIGNDEPVALNGDKVRVPGSERRERVELTSHDNRLMSSDRVYVDEHVFDHLDDRTWRVGLYFGSAHASGRKLRDILQDGSFGESSLDVVWQPGPVGASFSYASHTSVDEHERGVDSTYEADFWRLAATYEFVPAPYSRGSLRRVHGVLFAGAQSGLHRIVISDGVVDIKDDSRANGLFGGLEVMYPFGSFWISGKGYVSQQKIEFGKLGYSASSVQQGYLLGGFYAF